VSSEDAGGGRVSSEDAGGGRVGSEDADEADESRDEQEPS
jgi:hypothetical protein